MLSGTPLNHVALLMVWGFDWDIFIEDIDYQDFTIDETFGHNIFGHNILPFDETFGHNISPPVRAAPPSS